MVQIGLGALAGLESNTEETSSGSFAKFSSGTSYKVRVVGVEDVASFQNYGIFKEVNSFVAKNPATVNERGFAVDNLTVWDKASKFLYDKAAKATTEAQAEELRKEAGKYRAKTRAIMAFIDLDTNLPIFVDVSQAQFKVIYGVITKNAKKLDKKAFELEKSGSGTSTTVSLTMLDLDDEDDITEKQRENFKSWDGKSIDPSGFEGLNYEADEAQQIAFLRQGKFDPALIGYTENSVVDADAEDDDEVLPF